MAVKIRLKRMGSNKKPFYRIVVADSRSPRDGKFIEEIGFYNPVSQPKQVKINDEIILRLKVSQDDMGKVIGKQGRIAKAIRTVIKSASNREKVKVSLEIV